MKMHHPELYFEPAGLYKQLMGPNPPVKLLRGSWLLKRARQLRRAPDDDSRRALALPRRQDLDEGAFIDVKELRGLPRGIRCLCFEKLFTCLQLPCGAWGEEEQLRVVAISHGWLTREHPDPRGDNLRAFADQVWRERAVCPGDKIDTYLAALICVVPCLDGATWDIVAQTPRMLLMHACAFTWCCPLLLGVAHGYSFCCLPTAGQPCCACSKEFPGGEFGVFYDFGSLHQRDSHGVRTDEEQAAFKRALGSMGSWRAAASPQARNGRH
jgi:hypothetical protein